MRLAAIFIIVIGLALGSASPAIAETTSLDPEAAPSKPLEQVPPKEAGEVLAAKTLDRFYDPIEVRGELFPELHNSEIDQLGLLACNDGKLDFITFQFDEWTEDGELVLKMGENNNAEKANNKLDPQDQLVFMARELGDRVEPAMWQKLSDKGMEIEVIDPLTQERAWAYLLHFPNKIPEDKLKTAKRVETETPEFRAIGDSYTVYGTSKDIGKKHYRTVINNLISVTPAAGGNGLDLTDKQKARASVRMLFGMLKLNFVEESVIGGVDKYFAGPVRGLCRNWAALSLPMKLKSPRFHLSVYVYDTMIFIPIQNTFPINPGYVLTDFQTTTGYDLHPINGLGMKYYSDTNPRGFLIDGYMSKEERKEYNDNPDNWRCVVGPQGWIVHRSLWDEDYRRQAKIRMKYIDDIEHQSPPDNFPGDLGYYYTESTIDSLEPRSYFFQLDYYWPYRLYTPDGPDMKAINAICNIRDNPLMIKLGDQEVENTAPVATPMTQ